MPQRAQRGWWPWAALVVLVLLIAHLHEVTDAPALPHAPPAREIKHTRPQRHGRIEPQSPGESDARTLDAPIQQPKEPRPDASVAEGALQLSRWLERNARDADETVDEFCRRSAAVPQSPAMRPSNDAAAFLAERVDWGEQIGLLHLAQPLVDRIDVLTGGWLAMQGWEYAGLDFGWLTQLLEFDGWSVGASGPLAARDDDDSLPDWSLLKAWAALRLVKGLNEGALDEAIREVRHLGVLVASTGIPLATKFRYDLFELERQVRATTSAPLSSLPPPPLTSEGTEHTQLTLLSPYFLLPGVSLETKSKALKCAPARCEAIELSRFYTAAMRSMLPEGSANRAVLADHLPRRALGCDDALLSHVDRVRSRSFEQVQQLLGENPLRAALGHD